MTKFQLIELRRRVTQSLLQAIDQGQGLVLVKAPPGSGKTYITLRGMALARHRGLRVAVAAQTNNQADDIVRRFAARFPMIPITRFAAADHEPPEDLPGSVRWLSEARSLPVGADIVVATSAKWAVSRDIETCDWLFIDEAWQLSWAEFMLLGEVAARFVLVGDPGQIEPTVRIDVSRWQTSHRKPHDPAPRVLLNDSELPKTVLELPVSTRLPADTVELVRPFYDFDFQAWSQPGERQLLLSPAPADPINQVWDSLGTGSVILAKAPTPESVLSDGDLSLAQAAATLLRRLLSRYPRVRMDGLVSELKPSDVGVVATHRVMVTQVNDALGDLAGVVRCDTVERWQGLERKIMIALHPLSSQPHPTVFDLNAGRLNVLLSRHQVGLVLLSRDHVGETLAGFAPVADQAVGAVDESGRGHSRHWGLWRQLEDAGRVLEIEL